LIEFRLIDISDMIYKHKVYNKSNGNTKQTITIAFFK